MFTYSLREDLYIPKSFKPKWCQVNAVTISPLYILIYLIHVLFSFPLILASYLHCLSLPLHTCFIPYAAFSSYKFQLYMQLYLGYTHHLISI